MNVWTCAIPYVDSRLTEEKRLWGETASHGEPLREPHKWSSGAWCVVFWHFLMCCSVWSRHNFSFLQVLKISLLGHRKRIIASLAERPYEEPPVKPPRLSQIRVRTLQTTFLCKSASQNVSCLLFTHFGTRSDVWILSDKLRLTFQILYF